MKEILYPLILIDMIWKWRSEIYKVLDALCFKRRKYKRFPNAMIRVQRTVSLQYRKTYERSVLMEG